MNAEYKKWCERDDLDEATKKRLAELAGDENAIAGCFAVPMRFGTAGLRSTMDVGISKMNRYTVAQTTQGLAKLVIDAGGCERGVAICYDSRNNSELFARVAAEVLAGNGIKVLIFDELRPTPELSFAVLHYGCIAGINITASHNPKEYNGYKVYWEDGAQLPPEHAATVSAAAAEADIFDGVKKTPFDKARSAGIITVIGAECDEAFMKAVLECRLSPGVTEQYGDRAGIAYTALHGTGYRLVPEVLRRCGINNLFLIKSQMNPDGDFPTVASPNPENRECFDCAVKAISEAGADCGIIIATDPDADRIGLCVRDEKGEFRALSGNQIGALLIDYIIRTRRESGNLPKNAAAIKSVVSSNLFDAICEKNGVYHTSVLTGFKYIGEKIAQWSEDGSHTFIFGYEESQGYLTAGYARDKDAVAASMLVAEMACSLYAQGKTVWQALCGIYAEYGCYREGVLNVKIGGIDPMSEMEKKMAQIRAEKVGSIGGMRVCAVRDYKTGLRTADSGETTPVGLPESDMLYYELADGSAVIIRPSGTEPKIKAYILIRGENEAEAGEKLSAGTDFCKKILS